MSGFSADWLRLREPVDHRSRSRSLQRELSDHYTGNTFSGQRPMRIVDLGCGTGSNLRALAPELPTYQHWTLVDHDSSLLLAAKHELASWANSVSTPDLTRLSIQAYDKTIDIEFLPTDLALHIEAVLDTPADLVTAAAFFDLVSTDWLKRFCLSLKSCFYTVLTYNGHERWAPVHTLDASVLAAFHRHQQYDKGFGISAGPTATDVLITELQKRAFIVRSDRSPWLLSKENDEPLIQALARGTSQAVRETGDVSETDLQQWLSQRLTAHECEIGHWDLFARQ